MIGLQAFKPHPGSLGALGEPLLDLRQGFAPVEMRLARAEQIEIRSVKQQDGPGLGGFSHFSPTNAASSPQFAQLPALAGGRAV
jgi:hypothetical protein